MQIIKAARGNLTGHFGDTDVPGANVKEHGGMDIGHGDMTADDLRVIAPASGTVTFEGFYGTYGLCIIIDHGDGWESLLGHLDETHVSAGATVALGQDIAVMGDSGGDWPVHLHQELRRFGVQLNPEHYLTSTPAGGTGTPIANTGDDDMATLELVQSKTGAEGIFYSVNRLQRRHVPNPATLKDYQYFIEAQKKAGNAQAKPDVQIVANLDAFGVVVK